MREVKIGDLVKWAPTMHHRVGVRVDRAAPGIITGLHGSKSFSTYKAYTVLWSSGVTQRLISELDLELLSEKR